MRVAALTTSMETSPHPRPSSPKSERERTNLVVVGGEVLRGPMVRETLCCPRSGYESGSPESGTIGLVLREAANWPSA